MSILVGSHRPYQEREYRGYRWLWPGTTQNVASPPMPQQRVSTTQEIPLGHPRPQVFGCVTQSGVRVTLHDWAITSLEWPSFHPISRLHPSGSYFQNIAAPPQVQSTAVTRQEQPPQAPSSLVPSFYAQGLAALPTVRSIIITGGAAMQDVPFDHPKPRVWPGIYGPNVRILLEDSIITVQEQPKQPLSQFVIGIQGPDVRVPVADRVIITQEQPRHPLPWGWSGVQPPNVMNPVGLLVTRQEQPRDAFTFLRAYSPLAQIAVNLLGISTITRQEQPFHPSSRLFALPPTPTSFAYRGDRILIRQELPSHPPSRFGVGIQGPNVRPGIRDLVLTRQEQPWHPGSLLILPPLPNFVPPVFRGIIVPRWELFIPSEDPSFFLPGHPPVPAPPPPIPVFVPPVYWAFGPEVGGYLQITNIGRPVFTLYPAQLPLATPSALLIFDVSAGLLPIELLSSIVTVVGNPSPRPILAASPATNLQQAFIVQASVVQRLPSLRMTVRTSLGRLIDLALGPPL